MNKPTTTRVATHASYGELSPPSSKVALRTALITAGLILSLVACSPQPSRDDLRQTGSTPVSSVNHQLIACVPAQLAFRLASEDGRFNGMSHSGTALTLRNIGTSACTIPVQPTLAFTDTNKQTLKTTAQSLPDSSSEPRSSITLVPEATATSDLRWVSNDVYENGHCEFPAYVTLGLGKQAIATVFVGHLCGAGGKPPVYTRTSFKPAEAPLPSETTSLITYTCADGRSVQAVYPDTSSAVITFDHKTHHLHTATSADGARYVGDQWQWWTKGMRNAQLAPLKSGETIASARGVACHAP